MVNYCDICSQFLSGFESGGSIMNNSILEQQPSWRYCRVRGGEKRPYPNGWQNTPLRLEQIDSESIGLMLGPFSGGIVAVDFDGVSAIDWFEREIGCELPTTPTWSSGKPGRCQMAFQVPAELWQHLRTKKFATGEGEGFEFRWAGGQSVLPPSRHPETQQPYQWIVSAAEPVAELPYPLLEYWIGLCHDEPEQDLTPEVRVEDITEADFEEAERVMQRLKEIKPVLNYDEWRSVCWALAHFLGRSVATVLVVKYYPEQHRNEYQTLYRTWNKAKSPTIATIKHMIGESRVARQQERESNYIKYLKQQEDLQELRLAIQRKMKNGY